MLTIEGKVFFIILFITTWFLGKKYYKDNTEIKSGD